MSKEPERHRVYTPNQVVAYNLRRARLLKGWSQEQTARRLAPHLGVRWSRASYSLAERSFERPDRIRNFAADEVVAFALTFDLPILWFFFPPDVDPGGEAPRIAPHGVPEDEAHLPGLFIELIFGRPETQALLAQRLSELWKNRPAEMEGSFMKLLDEVSGLASRSAISHVVGGLEEWAKRLRDLAALLEESGASTANTMEAALNRLLDDYYGELLEGESGVEPDTGGGSRQEAPRA